ncbi:MAG: hypothetical protein HGA85_05370 [Nanoarchaeota archaeon]|nr:hypothetical protein [Nanoarchaeota archaeon]
MKTDFSQYLQDVPADRTFKTGFGELRNVHELKSFLQEKGESVYASYANESENHFANWVEAVIGDKTLAKGLRGSSFSEALQLVEDRVNYLKLSMKFSNESEELFTNLAALSPGLPFSPSSHTFSTNLELEGIESIISPIKSTPPKATFMPSSADPEQQLAQLQSLYPETKKKRGLFAMFGR